MANPFPNKLTTYASRLLTTICVLAGLFSLFFTWLFWARFHINIPVDDTLRLLPTAQSFVENGWGGVSFQEWISHHASAHRIAVGRLLVAMEYKYLSGGNTLMYLVSWLSIGVLCVLYSAISRFSKPGLTYVSVFMFGLALIYTCSYTQTSNIIIPITGLWYIGAACSAFSFYLLLSPTHELSAGRAIGSCLFAMVAAFCVFSGVITCLLVAVLAIFSRSRHALWVTVLMLAFVLLYLQGVASGAALVLEKVQGGTVDISLWQHFQRLFDNRGKLFHYTIVFLSAPLSNSPTLLSYLYVIPSFVLILYGWITLARQWSSHRSSGSEAPAFYLAMATVSLGTAIACYLGRGFFSSPSAPRYQTTVMLYWLSIGGLLLHSLPGKHDARATTAYMILALLIPAGLFYAQTEYRLSGVINKSKQASATEISTRLGFANFRDPAFSGDRYTPEYSRHETFLSNHTRLRKENDPSIVTDNVIEECKLMHMRLKPAPGGPDQLSLARLTIDGNNLQRYRRVMMIGPTGNPGYLYALPDASASLIDVIWGNTKWEGYYRSGPEASPVTLVFDSVLGPDLSCRLTL